jgi:hypothetical protein
MPPKRPVALRLNAAATDGATTAAGAGADGKADNYQVGTNQFKLSDNGTELVVDSAGKFSELAIARPCTAPAGAEPVVRVGGVTPRRQAAHSATTR